MAKPMTSLPSTSPVDQRRENALNRAFDQDRALTRLRALKDALQRTDRILTGRAALSLNITATGTGNPPAFSNQDAITVNLSRVPDPEKKSSLILMLGLNYHEVAHVLHSPSIASMNLASYTSDYTTDELIDAFKILEEGRIETRLVAKYGKMAKYLTYVVVEFFVKNKSEWPTAFLLTHGRKYLPRDIRDSFRAQYEEIHGTDLTQRIAEVIDRFRLIGTLTASKNHLYARGLIEQLAKLLKEANSDPKNECRSGAENHKPESEDTELTKRVKEETEEQEKKEEQERQEAEKGDQGEEDDTPEETDGPGSDEQESDDDPEGDPEGEGTDSQDANAEGSPDGDSADQAGDDQTDSGDGSADKAGSDEPAEPQDDSAESESESEGTDEHADESAGESSQDSPGGPGGDSAGKTAGLSREELTEALKDVLDQVYDSPEVQNDVSALQDSMDDLSSLEINLNGPAAGYPEQPVTDEMARGAEYLATALQNLWARMEPGWNYGHPDGRINMNRAALATSFEDYENIYDRWEEGEQDNAGTEVYFSVDGSGSMATNGRRLRASQILWMLMKAFEIVEAKTTVVAFNGESMSVYKRGETVDPTLYRLLPAAGGTVPTETLEEGRRVLNASEQPNKLLVVISDGQWQSRTGRTGNSTGEILLSTDATRLAILIDGFSANHFDEGIYFDQVSECGDVGSVFDVVSQTVLTIIERVAERP